MSYESRKCNGQFTFKYVDLSLNKEKCGGIHENISKPIKKKIKKFIK